MHSQIQDMSSDKKLLWERNTPSRLEFFGVCFLIRSFYDTLFVAHKKANNKIIFLVQYLARARRACSSEVTTAMQLGISRKRDVQTRFR